MKQTFLENRDVFMADHSSEWGSRKRWSIFVMSMVCVVLVFVLGSDKLSAAGSIKESEPSVAVQVNRLSSASIESDQTAETTAAMFYRKAFQLHQKKQLDQAIRMYRQLLTGYPKDYKIRFNFAAACIEARKYLEAYELLYELHRGRPEDRAVLLNLAIAEIGLDRLEEAVAHLEKPAENDGPLMFEIWLHLGIAKSLAGKPDEAVTWYEKAEKRDPDNLQLLFNMGLAFDKQQQTQKALEYYRRFLRQKGLTRDSQYQEVSERIKAFRNRLKSGGNQ